MKKILFLLLLPAFTFAQTKYRKDFDYLWKTLHRDFACFDRQKTDWEKVKNIYGPAADTVSSDKSFIRLLETVMHELYNPNARLNTNLGSSNRMVPGGSDIHVEYNAGKYIITGIREGYNADRCGLKPGMEITRYNRIPVSKALRKLLPRSVAQHDKAMYEYAANMLLAGTHDGKRRITARAGQREKDYYPDSLCRRPAMGMQALLSYRMLEGEIGYIRINNYLGNTALIPAFDKALDSLSGSRGLILDLRETPDGGDTAVARAIMGRFIESETPYQRRSLPAEGKAAMRMEILSPRGKAFSLPVIVLAGPWTAGTGEEIAIGLDGMKRALVIGGKMAGLPGASRSYTLPETKLGFTIPAERLYHISGQPGEDFIPTHLIRDNEQVLQKAIDLLMQ